MEVFSGDRMEEEEEVEEEEKEEEKERGKNRRWKNKVPGNSLFPTC